MNGTCQGGDALLFARTRTDVSFLFIIASTDFCSFYFFFPYVSNGASGMQVSAAT